jgi:hypothetical protein
MGLVVEVVGLKAFKGVVQGDTIDSGKLFARVKFDTRFNEKGKNFAAGQFVEEWRLPSAEHVFRMQHIPLPFMCDLEVDRVSNGKETKEVVIDCRPVDTVKPMQPPVQVPVRQAA